MERSEASGAHGWPFLCGVWPMKHRQCSTAKGVGIRKKDGTRCSILVESQPTWTSHSLRASPPISLRNNKPNAVWTLKQTKWKKEARIGTGVCISQRTTVAGIRTFAMLAPLPPGNSGLKKVSASYHLLRTHSFCPLTFRPYPTWKRIGWFRYYSAWAFGPLEYTSSPRLHQY